MSKVKRLFWDLEIVPNIGVFWEAGWRNRVPWTNILEERKIVCICAKWEQGKRLLSWTWDENKDDEQLLRNFVELANLADELVAHNGDKYDRRMFAGRCFKYGIRLDPNIKTFDTYQVSRRRFKLNSYSLKYLAHYLGLKHGKDEMEFKDWLALLTTDKKAPLTKMVKYCKQDVRVLQEVYSYITPYHNPKTHGGVVEGRDRWSCPQCGSENVHKCRPKALTSGIIHYQMRCKDCGQYYNISTKLAKDYNEAKLKL